MTTKNRAGRPAIGDPIQIRLPADTLAEIDATAEAEGVTRSQWIRQAIAARLHAAKPSAPTYTITDKISGTVLTDVDRYEIADTLKTFYEDAPDELLDVCEALEAKLHRGDYYGDEEAYLQVEVTRA